MKSMLFLLFIPFEVLQLLSLIDFTRRVYRRRSIYAVSIDFTLYSWVWCFTHTVANSLYTFLSKVQSQYAVRYPLYSDIPCSETLSVLSFIQLCVSTFLVKKVFFEFKSQEQLSLVCKTVLIPCFSIFLWFFWLFSHGKATINLLDLADCLHNIGSIALASRLIPQISLNWFLDCFPLSKAFILLQFLAFTFATLAIVAAYTSGFAWFEIPMSLPSQVVIGASWCALAILAFQQKQYGSRIMYTSPKNLPYN